MSLHWTLPAALAAAALIPAATRADPPRIRFDTGKAVAEGSGCDLDSGDTRIITAGNDISIVIGDLAVRLPGGPTGTSLSGLRSCAARVPATLAGGSYLAWIQQSIEYGLNKSSGSTGKITALAGFAARERVRFTIDIPTGARTASHLRASQTSPFMTSSDCRGEDVTGLFAADVAIAGERTGAAEKLELGAVGHDLRYDLTLSLEDCP